MYRVLDLFCGTGGISFGLGRAHPGFVTVAGVDLNEAACRTAQANHTRARVLPEALETISAAQVLEAGSVEAIDVIVGGPPCQGFSSLRPSRGTTLDDPRNRLYREYQRMVAQLRPRVFLLENVVGLVNATKGALLADLMRGFGELGYRCDWRILNAANYGVPQKRERFFLLGIRSDLATDEEVPFPAPTHSFKGRTIGVRDRDRMLGAGEGLPAAVSAWEAISDLPALRSGESSTRYRTAPKTPYQRLMRGSGRSVSLHDAANHNAKMLKVMQHAGASKAALPAGLVTSGYSSCYSRISADEPAPTITVKFTSPASSKCIHPFDNRAITPREAARLQSFPDDFVFVGSKTEIASQLGNAVPPLLAAAFAPVLSSFLETQESGVAR
jgi:DNA (cytosine-5)-methyltransferase 1